MDKNFFIYQEELEGFVKKYSDIFSRENDIVWEDYVKLFERRSGGKLSLFSSTWRFDNDILLKYKDKIVFYHQDYSNNAPVWMGLIQVSDNLHLRTTLIWDTEENKLFTGFEFVYAKMSDVLAFRDENKYLIHYKDTNSALGFGSQKR